MRKRALAYLERSLLRLQLRSQLVCLAVLAGVQILQLPLQLIRRRALAYLERSLLLLQLRNQVVCLAALVEIPIPQPLLQQPFRKLQHPLTRQGISLGRHLLQLLLLQAFWNCSTYKANGKFVRKYKSHSICCNLFRKCGTYETDDRRFSYWGRSDSTTD